MKINEIFTSIQGEGKHIGKPSVFIRFSGCNLRCAWCDTKYAYSGGQEITVAEAVKRVRKLGFKNVCITGGEPMLQIAELRQLIKQLKSGGYDIVLETNGTQYDKQVFGLVDCVSMDMKPPSSGEKSDEKLLNKLADKDQVKVIIADDKDLAYAKKIIDKSPAEVILQPKDGRQLKGLASEAIKLRLNARVLPQLHKMFDLK